MSDPTKAVFKKADCGSCNAEIIWATTVKGIPMPVDYEPNPAGTVELHHRPGQAPRAVVVGAGQAVLGDTPELRRSHFATCPNADQHRRQPARRRK